MIGTTLERRKTARESKVRTLVFFLTLSVILHGTFFPHEWLILGAGMAFTGAWGIWGSAQTWRISLTDGLFFSLVSLSLVGLFYPVKTSEGWLDAVRWFVFWMSYRAALTLREERSIQVTLRWITGLGGFLAIVGLIPLVNRTWPGIIPITEGRLTSLFGYPNALAAYYAAALLLKPRSIGVRAVLFLALLNTGSRAAISLFIIVWVGRGLLNNFFGGKPRAKVWLKGKKEKLIFLALIGLGIFYTVRWNPQVITHLFTWGITTSIGERILYIHDGIELVQLNWGIPRAGGWFTFPLVQNIPYSTSDPHSLAVRVLLHQGVLGFIFLGGWGLWIVRKIGKTDLKSLREKREPDLSPLRGVSAIFFLMLHALVDADFLFGALGLLFWVLIGMLSGPWIKDGLIHRRTQEFLLQGMRLGLRVFLLGLGFVLLATALNPQWMERTDLTNPKIRQEEALTEIEAKGLEGLDTLENVLAWEKFNLRTYEWAQGIVFKEAEKRKAKDPEEARGLYRWVANIPQRILSVREVSAYEKVLWEDAVNFQPSELNLLLARYAEERQLTLP